MDIYYINEFIKKYRLTAKKLIVAVRSIEENSHDQIVQEIEDELQRETKRNHN